MAPKLGVWSPHPPSHPPPPPLNLLEYYIDGQLLFDLEYGQVLSAKAHLGEELQLGSEVLQVLEVLGILASSLSQFSLAALVVLLLLSPV